ncbi:MAG: glucose-6-phosphate dehydrogenase [Gemmatimonadota bacterium]|nr:MAG: glucose-6-phosphate dehydrogenase [Gemmatimonadota bacterium]
MKDRQENSAAPAGRCAIVIFGAAGDLTRRKLIPALYNLAEGGLLPDEFAIVGFARRLDDEEFRRQLRDEARRHLTGEFRQEIWDWLDSRVYRVIGDLSDPEAYVQLKETLAKVDEERGTGGNYLYYMSTPPSFFSEIPRQLNQVGLAREAEGRWRRVVIEKPFGRDLDSARSLNRELLEVLDESQIYRIDHYLGKETVQNILVFRFANAIFEPIWNRRYVDHVQISVAERVDVGTRGGYYDHAGALRDMVPNHLFQLLALIAMEPPVSFEADAVRNEKGKIFRAINPIEPDEVLDEAVRGQYGDGTMPDGERVMAYRSAERVAPDSATETYVALKLMVDNWRWAGVPFYLRTGKSLPKRVTEIAIQFKSVPLMLFEKTPIDELEPNVLVLRIQPDEGISLSFGAKVPGPVMRIGGVDMDFCNANYFDATPATGYETLLYDCMKGDANLFQRGDNAEAAWSVVNPILDVWSALTPRDFPNYTAGSWGPEAADELMRCDGRAWRKL